MNATTMASTVSRWPSLAEARFSTVVFLGRVAGCNVAEERPIVLSILSSGSPWSPKAPLRLSEIDLSALAGR